MTFNIFKIEYDWCEGEHEETLLGKEIEIEEFENDLREARESAKNLKEEKSGNGELGKSYSVECLPEYYKQIIWFLINKKGYTECSSDDDVSYNIDDSEGSQNIVVRKYEKKKVESEL